MDPFGPSGTADGGEWTPTGPASHQLPFFSGGGLLLADWLRTPLRWLRCVAATYPVLAPLARGVVDQRFRPAEAVTSVEALPIVLTRVGRERPEVAATVEAFVEAARAGVHAHLYVVGNGRVSWGAGGSRR